MKDIKTNRSYCSNSIIEMKQLAEELIEIEIDHLWNNT